MSFANRWEKARLEVFRARIRNLVDAQKWPQALTAIIDFAQWADDRITDPETWLDLTVTATRIVGHLEDPVEYRAFLTHFASPFLGNERRPRAELIAAFSSIAEYAEPSLMISIGHWLTDARQTWPLGPYLVAHFHETINAEAEEDKPRSDMSTPATYFQIAAERARQTGLDDWELHVQFRQGALLLTTGLDRQRGREILGEIDWTQLYPSEQLWMAIALTSSMQWTDRLRAMDIVLDLHRAVTTARPRYRDLRLRDLRHAASTIFKLAGLHLPEAEDRRLAELSETLFSGIEFEHWTSFLSSRRQLSDVASVSFDDNAEVLPLLDRLGQIYPQRWQPAAHRFRILTAGWNGEYQSTDSVPSPRRHGNRLPIVDNVAELLTLLDSPNDSLYDVIYERLKRLTKALLELETSGDPAAARPVALLWPRILAARKNLDAEKIPLLLTDLASKYASVAPPPSYGWWQLAAHFFEAELGEAAAIIATQALVTDTNGADEDIRRYVASRAFEQTVDSRNADEARRWLDAI